MVLPQLSHRTRQEQQSWAPRATGNPQAAWRQVPGWDGCFTTWSEGARGREPSCIAKAGWNQHMPAAPSQEQGHLGGPWCGPCRFCMHAAIYVSNPQPTIVLNLYYSSIDVLGKIFLSLCALCWALQDKYWPLQPHWFMWALLSSCDGRCDWKDALHSHPRSHAVCSGQPGFLISLLDPYAAL